MEKKLKIWELALMAGLLVGSLCSPVDAAQPLSRWQTQGSQMRYQVSLIPFGIAEAERSAMAEPVGEKEPEYEIKFKILEWWEAHFG